MSLWKPIGSRILPRNYGDAKSAPAGPHSRLPAIMQSRRSSAVKVNSFRATACKLANRFGLTLAKRGSILRTRLAGSAILVRGQRRRLWESEFIRRAEREL